MNWTSLRRAFDYIGMLAAMGALALAIAGTNHFDHRWPDLLVQFIVPGFWFTLIGVVVAAVLRLRLTLGVGLGALIFLGLAAWGQWFPATHKPMAGQSTITVYTANLWARNVDVEAMKASITAANPDIILLVEVGNAPAQAIDDLLEAYPYRAMSKAGNITVAPARALVASRWPLTPLPENTHDSLAAMAAIVDTPLGNTGVMAAHLTRPWPFQYQYGQIKQVEDLALIRPYLGQKAIIGGDFNSVSTGRIGRQVRASTNMTPAHARLGTWPAKVPALFGLTIDQVWYGPELSLVERKLGQKNGSDHRPVITRFTAAHKPN